MMTMYWYFYVSGVEGLIGKLDRCSLFPCISCYNVLKRSVGVFLPGKNFTSNFTFKKHIAGGCTKPPEFACPTCKQDCGTKEALREHDK